MSHFFVQVLVPSDTKDIEKAVAKLLEPYNEHTRVPEYEKECWCVGRQASRAASEAADKEVGDIDSFRKSFEAAHPLPEGKHFFDLSADEEEALDVLWAKHLEPHRAAEKRHLDANPLKGKPAADCEECHGTGKEKTTYNPKSQWDWWVIGGRWDKVITGGEGHSRNAPAPLGAKGPRGNVIPVSDLMGQGDDAIPFAVVTPDGEWHQRAKMGWWGTTRDGVSMKEWRQQARELWAKHRDALAVGVDCHI